MILSLIFFLINFEMLSNSNTAFVKIKIKNEKDELIENAKIVYRYGKNELANFTNVKGESEFDLDSGIRLLKIYKEGFYSKGHVENFKIGENNLVIKLSPKVGEIKGIISSNNNILPNVSVALIDEKGDTFQEVKSSSQGAFTFYNIPIFRKYYLKVIEENFLPYRSDEIILKDKKNYTRNIHLKTNETILIIEVSNRKNEPLSKIFVEIDGREHETDGNGMTMFKILPTQKENVIIKIREYKIEEKVKIIKGKKYLGKKIVID